MLLSLPEILSMMDSGEPNDAARLTALLPDSPQIDRTPPTELANRDTAFPEPYNINMNSTAKSHPAIRAVPDEDVKEEEDYVKSTLHSLQEANPHYNVLIYHDQKSRHELSSDAVHAHYELQHRVGTKGYEIYVFSTDSFDRAGPGGYSNWGVSGCFKVDGKHVDFGDINNCPYW